MEAILFRPMLFGCPPGIQTRCWIEGLLLLLLLRLLLPLPRAESAEVRITFVCGRARLRVESGIPY